MPTYDYECDACDHKFELYQSISAEPEKVCPKCKKKKLRRLIGAGGAVMFKGSGFYQTDYRSDSYKKSASAETGSKSGAAEKSSSDAKPTSEKSTTTQSEATGKSDTPASKSTGKKAD